MSIKLLFLAGSARQESVNKKLARYAAAIAKDKGAEATFIDLKDFELPLYDGDYEEAHGLPENAIKLKELFIAHDGFFIASPEYNSSFSALLKNALDWMSRPHIEGEKPLSAYAGKVCALSAASPGALGGLRGLVPLRMLLGNIAVTLTPSQAAIGSAFDAFDEKGKLTQDRDIKMMDKVISELVDTTQKLKG